MRDVEMTQSKKDPSVPALFSAESFKAYEDGKQRRYALLFAVTGGAFAIAQLLVPKTPIEPSTKCLDLKHLSFVQLSLGMIFFAIVMGFDIWMFGRKMRKYLPDAFTWQGMLVLVSIISLICAGWFLAADLQSAIWR